MLKMLLADLFKEHKHGYSRDCGELSHPLPTKYLKLKDVGQTPEWGGRERGGRREGADRRNGKRKERRARMRASAFMSFQSSLSHSEGLLTEICRLWFFIEF